MKRMFKKIATTALATVMALSAVVALNPTTVKADGWEADFSYADADWSPSVWGAADDGSQADASTTVTGAGSYSMTIDTSAAAGEGVMVFVVDIVVGQENLAAQNYRVSDLKLTVDGSEFAIDTSKIVTGDIEEKGNFRIELFNAYGPTAVSEKYDASVSPFDPATFTTSQSIKVDFTLEETDEPAYDADGKSIKYVGTTANNGGTVAGDDSSDDTASGEFDPNGSYNAYFGLQSPSWTYRDAWDSETTGKGTDSWGDFVINNDSKEKYGKVTDAVVSGNGTYSVSLKEIGDVFSKEFADNADGLTNFRILMVSTDIPMSDSIKVTDVKLIMDGSVVTTYKDAFLDPDSTDYVKILVQNEWNPDLKETLPFYSAPTDSIEIQFTISGFENDNKDAVVETPTTKAPAGDGEPETSAPADDKENGGNKTMIFVIVVVVLVAVVAIVLVLFSGKKEEENKEENKEEKK